MNNMNKIKIEPEVPAGMGELTEFDKTEVPWKIKKLHLIFEGLFNDDLLTCSPAFYVTERLKSAIENSELTGVSKVDPIIITKSENFEELYPNNDLPSFYMLRISEDNGGYDFNIYENSLYVSENALSLLKKFNLSEAEIGN